MSIPFSPPRFTAVMETKDGGGLLALGTCPGAASPPVHLSANGYMENTGASGWFSSASPSINGVITSILFQLNKNFLCIY